MEAPELRVKRSRNRKVKTCLECRRLKRKCTKTQPCTHCIKTSRECVYPSASALAGPQKSGLLSVSGRSDVGSFVSGEEGTSDASADAPGVYTPRMMSAGSGKSSDMCLLIGRLNITERIGGLRRVNIVPFLDDLLRKRPDAASGADFDQMSAPIMTWFKPHTPMPLGRLLAGITSELNEDIYVDLSQLQIDILLKRFFQSVHPVCPLIMRADVEVNDSFTSALRLSATYAAAVSLPMLDCKRLLGESKDLIVKKLKAATEDALCRIDIFNCFELRMFQAVLVYLTPQFLAEISRSQSVFIAAICRHFQIAGFTEHNSQLSSDEQQLLKHIWNHIMFLNIRATEAVGPEGTLIDDPHAKLPDLRSSSHRWDGNDHSTVALIRYECYTIHRMIFRERENLKHGLLTFATAMKMVDDATRRVEQTYLNSLDASVPIQRYAGVVGKLLLARAETMMLHTQMQDLRNATNPVQTRNRIIRSCLQIMEAGVTLETDPQLASWAWYSGAYQQYHSIIFPLCQVFLEPDLPDAQAIMEMANYVFGPSSTSSAESRSASILRSIRNSMDSFLLAIGSTGTSSHAEDLQYDAGLDASWTDILDHLPDTSMDEMSQGLFDQFGSNTVSPFGPDGAEMWWRWPLPVPPA